MNTYDTLIDDLMEKHISDFLGTNNAFTSVIKYCLKDGKRIRPKIAFDICQSVSHNHKTCGLSALSIEYIHTASLIIDDLPCMDNACQRRNHECVHIKYGQAVAQLTSALLISMGMNAISTDLLNRSKSGDLSADNANKIGMFFLDNFSQTIGHNGAVGGQLLDLSTNQSEVGLLLRDVSQKIDIDEIISKKTGKFFETGFLIGWLIGGGQFVEIDQIKTIAHNFSMAFQIVDDLEDMDEDREANRKNVYQNYALKYGVTKAKIDAFEYLKKFKEGLDHHNLCSPFLTHLIKLLAKKLR